MKQATIYVAPNGQAIPDPTGERLTIAATMRDNGFDGGTIAETYGVDGGILERSYAVTIANYGDNPDTFTARIRTVSLTLRDVFAQDCVLVTWTEIESECSHDFDDGQRIAAIPSDVHSEHVYENYKVKDTCATDGEAQANHANGTVDCQSPNLTRCDDIGAHRVGCQCDGGEPLL